MPADALVRIPDAVDFDQAAVSIDAGQTAYHGSAPWAGFAMEPGSA